jgi:hypothetical protein
MTWDLPPGRINAHLPQDILAQLKAVGDSLAREWLTSCKSHSFGGPGSK